MVSHTEESLQENLGCMWNGREKVEEKVVVWCWFCSFSGMVGKASGLLETLGRNDPTLAAAS